MHGSMARGPILTALAGLHTGFEARGGGQIELPKILGGATQYGSL